MKELTAENVMETLSKCFFDDDDPKDNPILVEGVVRNFGFRPDRVEANRQDITDYLMQLPDTFRESVGGGWSFVEGCTDKDGRQWGDQIHAEALFAMGQAIKMVSLPVPKQLWKCLPGGVPYYKILI